MLTRIADQLYPQPNLTSKEVNDERANLNDLKLSEVESTNNKIIQQKANFLTFSTPKSTHDCVCGPHFCCQNAVYQSPKMEYMININKRKLILTPNYPWFLCVPRWVRNSTQSPTVQLYQPFSCIFELPITVFQHVPEELQWLGNPIYPRL